MAVKLTRPPHGEGLTYMRDAPGRDTPPKGNARWRRPHSIFRIQFRDGVGQFT